MSPSRLWLFVDLDPDGSRLRDFLLRKGDRQDPVLVVGADFFRVHRVRERERPRKSTVGAFDPMITLTLSLLELPFAFDAQGVVLEADLDVLELDVGHIHAEQEFVLRLQDIDRGRPRPDAGLTDEAIDRVLKVPHCRHIVDIGEGTVFENTRHVRSTSLYYENII